MGRIDESLVETRKLVELDPLSPWAMGHVGYHQLYARQYDEAIATFRPYLLKMKDDVSSHDLLGDAYYQKGMMGEAVEEFLVARALTGFHAEEVATLRRAFTERGIPGYLREWIEQLKRKPYDVRTPETIAGAYARLGDKDRAFQLLETAYAERNPRLVNLRENVVFDNLRDDPRFADLLRRIGLPPVRE
jgi:tetratricopeptide (TPR) repeat protein